MKTLKNILLLSFLSFVIISCGKEKAKGTVATLSDLQFNETTVDGFSSSVFDYSIVVGEKPTGGGIAPPPPPPRPRIVTYTLTDNLSSAVQTDATKIPGTTTIKVTSEDGQNSNVYSVNLIYE